MSFISQFGFSLFQQMSQESGNIVISPLSLWMALGMAATGSRNETLNQFLGILRVPNRNEIKTTSQQVMNKYNDSVSISNGFATPTTEGVKEEFMNDIKELKAEIFTGPDCNPSKINEWVDRQTKGKIPLLLDPTKQVETVLLNAVHFKADWKFPFKKQLTTAAPFFTQLTSSQPCQMMANTGNYRYFETEEFQSVQLPYQNEGISAIVVLPKSHQLFKSVVKNHSFDLFTKILASLETSGPHNRVELYLPKFKINYGATMNQYLFQIGLHSAFLQEADFSGISDTKMYIDSVIQKCFLQVDEKGTEAAAASAVLMSRSLPMPDPAIEMRCDRPFMFAIVDDVSSDVLFLSTVTSIE
jgi:serpin B